MRKRYVFGLFIALFILSGCTNAVPKFLTLESTGLENLSASIKQKSNQSDPTNDDSIEFDLQFSEEIDTTSFTNDLITLDSSSTGTISGCSISNQGDNKNFILQCSVATEGLIKAIVDVTKIKNTKNENFIKLVVDDNEITYDITKPTVVINFGPNQLATATALPIEFTATFSEEIEPSTFTSSDLANDGTASSLVWNIINTGDNKNFTLSISSLSEGTVIPKLAANAFFDLAQNANLTAYVATATVTYTTGTPEILSITSSTANGTYVSASVINIEILFNKNVFVTNFPTLTLETGSTDQVASYLSGSGSNTLVFQYTVQPNDYSVDLDYLSTSALSLNGGTIRDSSNVDAILTLPTPGSAGSLGTNKNIKIVGTPANLTASAANFGNVGINNEVITTVTIQNNSTSALATIASSTFVNASYNYEGGTFPGTSGTCSTTIAASASCTITLRFIPTDLGVNASTLNITYNDEVIATQNLAVSLNATGVVTVEPVYAGNSNWNDYVKNDSADIYSATNISCDGTETQDYFKSCIHGGEKRKVFVPGKICSQVRITDSLLAFDWQCKDNGSNSTFYIFKLKPNKGLRDLINTGGSWNSLYVTVTNYPGGSVLSQSTPTIWWQNTIAPVGGINTSFNSNLNTSGTIYYINSLVNLRGINITANKIGLVSLGANSFTYDNAPVTANCRALDGTDSTNDIFTMICSGSKNFLWIEADFNGAANAEQAVYLYNSKFSRIINTNIISTKANTSKAAIVLQTTNSNFLENISTYNTSGGIQLNSSAENIISTANLAKGTTGSFQNALLKIDGGSSYNRILNSKFSQFYSTHTYSAGVYIGGYANTLYSIVVNNISGSGTGILFDINAQQNNLIQATSFATNDTGLKVYSGDNNSILYYTSTNNIYNGIYLDGTNTSNNLFLGVALSNNDLNIDTSAGITASSTNKFVNIASTDAIPLQIYGSNTAHFSGYLIVPPSADCSSASGSNLTIGCIAAGVSNYGFDISSSFLAKVTTTDTANGTVGGSLNFSSITSVTKWLKFDNFWRGWGFYDMNTFPFSTHQGPCITGSCQIWDWRIHDNSNIHNKSVSGNISNPTFITGSTCQTGYNGEDFINHNGINFLKAAIEIVDDSVGNNNGLCESNEECIYAPNIGAYQGHGDLDKTQFCTTSGTVSGANYLNINTHL